MRAINGVSGQRWGVPDPKEFWTEPATRFDLSSIHYARSSAAKFRS
jgi:hypothetical protein